MFDLALAIIFSAMIPVILKYAHKKNLADEVILTFNYVIAFFVSLGFTLAKLSEYQQLFKDVSKLFNLVIIGIVTGILYYVAFYFYQKSVKDNGVSVSIAVGKMGIILPMILSLVLWKEIPGVYASIGILISMIAIGLININPRDFKGAHLKTSLLLFFFIGGLGDFANKLFEVVVGSDYKDLFLAIVFLSDILASLIMTIKHNNISKFSIIYGIAVGFPNMLTAFFLISALSMMNATIVFPMYSGGAIVLSMIWSVIAFKEQLKTKDKIGISMILLALVMVNL